MLPDAEWTALPGLGHVAMSDDPDLVAQTISGFVARTREPAAVTA
jgi:pimeloyl-ACP methyl ester carboxylesterase